VALRSAVPKIRIAGLERTARLAGEAFAHEELTFGTPRTGDSAQLLRLWWIAGAVALIGLAVLALR